MSEPRAERAVTLTRAVADCGRNSRPSAARVQFLVRGAGVAGVLVSATGIVVIAGWVLGLPALTRIAPDLVTMKFTTAVCLTALGAAITASAAAQLSGNRRGLQVGAVLAGLVLAVALVTGIEQVFGLQLPTDNPFGLDPGDPLSPVPGRMAQMTAVSLIALSTAVLLSARRMVRSAQSLAVLAATIGMTAVVGYTYGVRGLYGVGPFNTMAVHTAVAMVVSGLGVLFLRPCSGYVAVVVGNTAGGVIMRQVLPWALLLPYAAGGVIVAGLRHGLYDGRVALAIFVTVVANVGAALVWFQGEHLRDVDLRRGGAEDALRMAQEVLADRARIEAELAASVRRTRQILATAADAYIAIDTEGRVTDWNDAAAGVFGWSRNEAVGEFLENLIIPPSHAAAHQAGLTRYLRTGEAPILGQQLELEALNRSGARIPVELTVWADQEEGGTGFHAFVRDITARKRAEQNLRRLNADLAEFAAIAAHDLRSPLTTIQMQSDLVLAELETSDWGPEETRHWIQRIGQTADRGVLLIDDLLSYVSIGREAHPPRPVHLDALARDVVDAQLGSAGRPAACSVARLPVVAGDEAQLRQLVANLVGNAIKYVPADRTPEVVVDALVEVAEDRCILRVSDNGAGFAEDERERVFEMFQRGSGTAGVPGTGIGLAICRRVAERHGGRIWIEPSPSGGSRVCVELPPWSGALPDDVPEVARSDARQD
ncbi:sensor histidine kinase [Nocardioides pocheonensis]|uniref:Sensor-like histidine kinase SenX3 n=1 Tax=Nocardioides pocheonensis TaxID=661485 RepID=A0A3N0GJE9_9ACTN|nr:PAS domain-containing sensor histidine kinase [Nocardioides pocheonensis]RNM12541.1 PAS domain S-box protein [Nocardioides pocheonensis]